MCEQPSVNTVSEETGARMHTCAMRISGVNCEPRIGTPARRGHLVTTRTLGIRTERCKMSTLTLRGQITASLHAGSTKGSRAVTTVACACHHRIARRWFLRLVALLLFLAWRLSTRQRAPPSSGEDDCSRMAREAPRCIGPAELASGDVRELTSLPAIRTPWSPLLGVQIDAAPCLVIRSSRLSRSMVRTPFSFHRSWGGVAAKLCHHVHTSGRARGSFGAIFRGRGGTTSRRYHEAVRVHVPICARGAASVGARQNM